ncbi:hypothetical protein K0M31_005826 [Melipona bicolor]|uniref:Uncharacterized protein n=1 Tax=Melipona bicolor TaxID=60889 RepID=A0AA40FV69_9HYME|nr:hypothetical protein K0M31_005826 [Melipona bicolor]
MTDLLVLLASINRRLVLQHPNYRVLLLINATTSRPPALAVRIRQEPLDNDNLSDRPGILSVSQDNTSKRGIAQRNKNLHRQTMYAKNREQRPAIMAAHEPAFVPDLFRRIGCNQQSTRSLIGRGTARVLSARQSETREPRVANTVSKIVAGTVTCGLA